MATRPQTPGADAGIGRLKRDAVEAIQAYCTRLLDVHTRYDELRNKMSYIDTNYYRYQTESQKGGRDAAGNVQCGVNSDNMLIPMVISQVDSTVGYWAETFLSGYPLFPVVSTPKNVKEAEMMESIIDSHAIMGQYTRHLLRAFRAGAKYNFMPLVCEWRTADYYNIVESFLKPTEAAKLQKEAKGYTCLESPDPYNTLWDYRCMPADAARHGEFGGYIDRWARLRVKSLIHELEGEKCLYQAEKLGLVPSGGNVNRFWTQKPTINDTISFRTREQNSDQYDWDEYLGTTVRKQLQRGSYEVDILYLRLLPSEFNIDVPNKNTPAIFKVWMLNGNLLIGFKRIYTVMGDLPLQIGQPIEDNFDIQTPSIGEAQAGFQAAASTLWNVQLQGSRRAIFDRAIYDTDILNKSDVNSPHPSAKIPARLKGLLDKKLSDAYYQVPYDTTGLSSIVQAIGQLMDYSDMASGQNKPFRGQFQKGNKSVEEFRDTTGNADQRMRLPAMSIEVQTLMPCKETMKFNIFSHGVIGSFQNFKTGDVHEIKAEDLERMRSQALQFKIADGLSPKSKIASTESITVLLQTIMSSEPLMMKYGDRLPGMVAHIAQLMGVPDLDQYSPTIDPNAVPAQQPPSQGVPPNGAPGQAPAGQQAPVV